MNQTVDLTGKSILIMGGGRGIGLTIAETLKSAGADITIAARTISDLESATSQLQKISKGSLDTIPCDVTQPEQVHQACSLAAKKNGQIFGLVCAAGSHGDVGKFRNVDIDAWSKGIEINLIGTARTIHSALKFMPTGGSGRIVLFSGGGQNAYPHFSSYVAAKGGIWRLTETLGAELASERIYVNAIAPGAVYTQFLENLIKLGPDKVGEKNYQDLLQQKAGKSTPPQKAADLTLYLMSPASEGLYGKTLSAVWDPYTEFNNLEEMSRTDLFTFKRVVTPTGSTRF